MAERPEEDTSGNIRRYNKRDWPGHDQFYPKSDNVLMRYQKPDEPGGELAGDREPRTPRPGGPLIGRVALEFAFVTTQNGI